MHRSILLSNLLGKVYEKIIQQEVVNVFTENNFFLMVKVFAYQKNKNSSQALLRFIEQMLDTISSRKYSVAVMADLEGGFDPVWSKGAIYKLLKAGIYNNLLSVFSGFLKDRYSGNLIRGTQG